MKIAVFSDTHGNYPATVRAVSCVDPDLIVHLGDNYDDGILLEQAVAIPVLRVPGNCDVGVAAPRKLLRDIAGFRFLLCHGDRYYVKNGIQKLEEEAVAAGSSVVLFGHTHAPLAERRNGILYVNPGTMAESARQQTYAVITVQVDGVQAEIATLFP